MRSVSRLLGLASIALTAACILISTERATAGGAFAVDDAEVGKPGECKVESWVSAAANRDFSAVTSPACVVKLGIPVEFAGSLARTRADGVWGTSGGVKAKVNLIPVEGHAVGVGLAGGVNRDLIAGINTGGFIYVPLTVALSEKFKVNFNGGWNYDNVAKFSYLTYGAGFEWSFVEKFTLIGEVYGQTGKLPEWASTTVVQPRTQLGVRFTPMEKIDIDLIWGHNITGENSHWLTLGVNYRF